MFYNARMMHAFNYELPKSRQKFLILQSLKVIPLILGLFVVGFSPVLAQAPPAADAPSSVEKSYPQPADPPASLPQGFIPLEVNEFRTPIQAPILPQLRGPGIQFLGISKDMRLLNDGSEDRRPCRGCVAVHVRIVNQGTEPIMVDGNNARAVAPGKEVPAWSEEMVLKTSGGVLDNKQKAILAVTALTTFGLAEPIMQDHFTTSKNTLLKSYGDIVIRRRLEDDRLAKRIILPNEDTYASVFFPAASLPFEKVVIPLLNYPGGEPSGSLTVDAKGLPDKQ